MTCRIMFSRFGGDAPRPASGDVFASAEEARADMNDATDMTEAQARTSNDPLARLAADPTVSRMWIADIPPVETELNYPALRNCLTCARDIGEEEGLPNTAIIDLIDHLDELAEETNPPQSKISVRMDQRQAAAAAGQVIAIASVISDTPGRDDLRNRVRPLSGALDQHLLRNAAAGPMDLDELAETLNAELDQGMDLLGALDRGNVVMLTDRAGGDWENLATADIKMTRAWANRLRELADNDRLRRVARHGAFVAMDPDRVLCLSQNDGPESYMLVSHAEYMDMLTDVIRRSLLPENVGYRRYADEVPRRLNIMTRAYRKETK